VFGNTGTYHVERLWFGTRAMVQMGSGDVIVTMPAVDVELVTDDYMVKVRNLFT
jgi:hypothetical protein